MTMMSLPIGQRFGLLASVALLVALVALPGRADDEPDPEPGLTWPSTTQAHRQRSANNLKQIALALINFADKNGGGMPAHAIYSKAGKPLLSWRVAILPYIEQNALYKEFKLEEPWDSKHNKKLLAKMPKLYAPPVNGKPAKPNNTYYQVFTGPDTPFNPRAVRGVPPLSLGARFPASFTDGTSNTILALEAKVPVPWTKPDDLVYDAGKPIPKLGGLFREGFHVVLADGSVRYIGRKADTATLRALITPSGGEVIDWNNAPPPKPGEK
jgi:hypothetical protein